MAWNDVKYDDNAVRILVLIGGHSYKFNQTDIKVERKIGDTLNKFSLGVVDDGTDDYIEFERVVTSRFVNLEIHYGNSNGTTSKWEGFVADYQPVFLGPTTKLTVTGYISRKQAGLPDQTSPYLYYIDWAPVVGKRKDNTKDWDDIYNGNFSFTSDSFGNKLNDVEVPVSEEAQAVKDNIRAQVNSYIANEGNTLATQVLRAMQTYASENANKSWNMEGYFGFYYDDNGVQHWVTPIKAWFEKGDDGNYIADTIFFKSSNPYQEGDEPKDVANLIAEWAPVLGQSLITKLSTFSDTVEKYEQALRNLDDIRDTYGNVTAESFGQGHVPWDYEIMSKYEGNIEFSKFSHPKDSKRSIARPVPDLFVRWDRDVPMAENYLDDKGQPRSGDWELFPDDAINDIKVFGLQYVYNSASYLESPGDPYKAFILKERDIHKVKRVYLSGNDYYIWVGDCPELYKNWENAGWDYNSSKVVSISQSGAHVYGNSDNSAITDYSGNNGTFTPRLENDWPRTYNKYYNTIANGGYSTCIQGCFYQGGHSQYNDVLPNCVGWAAGRFHEIMGTSGIVNGQFKYGMLNCNAEGFVKRAKAAGLQVLQNPTLGGIMVWEDTRPDRAGHVSVVEQINSADEIVVSESEYKGRTYHIRTIKRSIGTWPYSSYTYLGCIVNPAIGSVSDGTDIIVNKPSGSGISVDEAAKWGVYEVGKEYEIEYYLTYKKSKYGVTEKKFKATDWDADVASGNIRLLSKREYDIYHIYGQGYKTYVIQGLKGDPDKGIKSKAAKDRIADYLKATYRSASPLNYGVVYISDIVAQLCILEGWKNPIIRTTTAVSYKSDFLNMDGMGALEYIVQKLCPNAMEDSSSARVGFTAYFDKQGIFHFEPIDANGANASTILTIGYNVQNTNVISFTVRSRGQILMLGIDETYEGVDSLTGATVSVTQNKNTMTMSETERILSNGSAAQFFNLALYNYYGYDKNSNKDYQEFTSKISERGGIDNTMPYGTSLVRRTYESSISNSTQAAIKAFNELVQLQNTSIKAELTMIGDNTIEPGKYIQIINYSRRGFHYTSGKYYIKSMTDSVTSGQGFTQSLELNRFSSKVPAMNTTPEDAKKVEVGISTKLDEAADYIKNNGLTNFDKWYEDNITGKEKVETVDNSIIHTFDCNGGTVNINGEILFRFSVIVKPGELIPEPKYIPVKTSSAGWGTPINYTFDYWYLDAVNGGPDKPFDFTTMFVPTNATFKAKYKESTGGGVIL